MPQTIHLFVFDTLADWEPGFAVAGINNPEGQKAPGRYRIRTVGVTRDPITTIGGVRIQPDLSLDRLQPVESAMLILPGGERWDHSGNMEAVEKAKAFLAAGVPVAAICGATAGLARGGVLDTRKHTSNAPDYLAATGYQGAHLYQTADVVSDQNLISASGMKSLEFAREIFARLDLYEDKVLDAWYGLFKTGDLKYYAALAG
ncbi:MAG TPA: type 1 glutamine amidotransferase family protein [Gemmatimonadales bacterium]|jgi:putative intracellular protease/amidase